ncbi:uncharacterized membrane protein YcaP (DUF421 family) [Bacillus sp. SLBN-46]|uniref:DUF421 domain-containing protein n=1 Tax=Bacillus sp. SLBN-46 TaxID=3042283 RepID=UPI002861DD2B|nr:DUF421 domain-containing protein [Bacillus sp. SLBN-46]MDR6123337.1 uncharacterized membrane protein YcaP (DUF421 family) [Bacillus sp. SLBN-46]
MDLNLIWKAILIVLFGTLLLRVAGRKTISQMTIAETVIMIALGSLLIQPVSGAKLGNTFMVGAVLVATLISLEFLQVKSNSFEKLITGKAKVVIENGVINETNLKKLRLTVDQLEMTLRQKNVTNFKDVKFATLEPNGQLGLTLTPEAQPMTKKEYNELIQILSINNSILLQLSKHLNKVDVSQENLFTEVKNESHASPPPTHLQ